MPCSSFVCLTGFHKITQVLFAEYHNKQNFVERVHAENRVLSEHGPFCSSQVHDNASVGSQECREDMEAMAEQIQGCICSGSFAREHLHCYTDSLIFKIYIAVEVEDVVASLKMGRN